MVATASMVGALMGLSCQFYSNGVRKLPLMRHPWEHLLAIGLGAGFGNAVANWEVRLQEDLDNKLSEVQTANKKRFIGNLLFLCSIVLLLNPARMKVSGFQKMTVFIGHIVESITEVRGKFFHHWIA